MNGNIGVDPLNPSELSFSGVDIIMAASINGKVYNLGSIETISISTHRDTTPVRVLGLDAPQAYKQGTRTISGTMVFSKIYLGEMEKLIEENPQFAVGDVIGYQAPDRLPPFNISIHVGTEYSKESRVAQLIGVTLMSAGMTLSIHDIYTEQTYGYVALEYLDLKKETSRESGIPNGLNGVTTLSSIYEKILGDLTSF